MNSSEREVALSLATRLVEQRVALAQSLADAAAGSGINYSIIETLERDGGLSLASVYRRAYLARYLAYLGLEADDELPMARHSVERSMKWVGYAIVSAVIVLPLVWFSIQHGALWLSDGLQDPAVANSPEKRVEIRQIKATQLPVRAQSLPAVSVNLPWNADPSGDGLEAEDGISRYVLSVALHSDSWFELSDATGKRLEHDLLRANGRRSYEGEPPFEVLVGRGDAVELMLNDQLIDHAVWSDGVSVSEEGLGLMKLRIGHDGKVEHVK